MRQKKSISSKGAMPLEAEGIHFTYESTGEKVLHGFDVKLNEGSILGMVGRNESGKTTAARVLTQKVKFRISPSNVVLSNFA
jgi:ABC-type multidrug transport system ATPase subunit